MHHRDTYEYTWPQMVSEARRERTRRAYTWDRRYFKPDDILRKVPLRVSFLAGKKDMNYSMSTQLKEEIRALRLLHQKANNNGGEALTAIERKRYYLIKYLQTELRELGITPNSIITWEDQQFADLETLVNLEELLHKKMMTLALEKKRQQ